MRADLLALTLDGLAGLTNRGLVKRAQREVEAGATVAVMLEDDGTIRGTHADGTCTTLPPRGGLDTATCSCGASGPCRHMIMTILRYQDQHAPGTPPVERAAPEPAAPTPDWSPAAFTDDQLLELVGGRRLAAARRVHRAGYSAIVHRPTPDDPVPTVELSTCRVRFLAPHDLGYVHTDAAHRARDEMVPLAVWAFRVADQRDPTAVRVRVDVGGRDPAALTSALRRAVELASELLLDGTVHSGPQLGATMARMRRTLDAQGLRWPLLAVEELAVQLAAYRERSATHDPARVALLLAELVARQRAGLPADSAPRASILGTEEIASTPLRRVALTGLGCRITGTERERTAEVYLAHTRTDTVLVLRKRWKVAEGDRISGADLARRKVAGLRLDALATGQLTSESATRSANRLVELATSHVAPTTIRPSAGRWGRLPDSLLVRDAAAFAAALAHRPPLLIRPRVEAESLRVLAIGEVLDLGYSPGDQRLDATVTDPLGTGVAVTLTHRAECPAALDSLAAALRGEHGRPQFISGELRRANGTLTLTPCAVAVTDGVVVPDLGDGAGAAVAYTVDDPREPVSAALRAALDRLGEAAHRGLRHLPAAFADRLREDAEGLRAVGLSRAGDAVDALAVALAEQRSIGATQATASAWFDAAIRLLTTAEYS